MEIWWQDGEGVFEGREYSLDFQYIIISTHRHIGIIGFHIAGYLIYVSLCFSVVQKYTLFFNT
jgi:hypothetical protein